MWKEVNGYEGLYLISDTGEVLSKIYKTRKILKPGTTKFGYSVVVLSKNKKVKMFAMHRLVALNFIDNPENKPCINHKNGIKIDNRVENLEWCTYSENTRHSFDVLKRKASKTMEGKLNGMHPNAKEVKQYTKKMELVKSYDSIIRASRESGHINPSNISACCLGKVKTAGGYIWRYK